MVLSWGSCDAWVIKQDQKQRIESQWNKWAFSLDCISETQWSDTYRCSINVWWVNSCLCPFIQHLLSIYVINKQIHMVYKVLWFLPSENSQWILRDYDDLLHITFELIYPHCRSEYSLCTSYSKSMLQAFHLSNYQSIHFLDNEDPSQFD